MRKCAIAGLSISRDKKSFIFPQLESLTIDDVQLVIWDLKIDLADAKLKNFNYADYTYGELDHFVPEKILVNFDVIQNVLSNQIESYSIKFINPQTIVSIMDEMKGICYPKLCHLDLERVKIELDGMSDNQSESIFVSVLGLLDNAENLHYIRLQDVIWSSEQLIRLLIKMKSLKRAFEIKVGTIEDNGTSFWDKLMKRLEVETIESNDCDGKIEVNCTFRSDKVIIDDLLGLLKDKYNIHVGAYDPDSAVSISRSSSDYDPSDLDYVCSDSSDLDCVCSDPSDLNCLCRFR